MKEEEEEEKKNTFPTKFFNVIWLKVEEHK